MTEHDFKPGDRVEYVGEHFGLRELRFMTITAVDGTWACIDEPAVGHPMLSNLRHVPDPDEITIKIRREDLPPVSAAYEAADFPDKDTPRIALAILLDAGWDSADEVVCSLRSIIRGYEDSIADDAKAARREELADFWLGYGWEHARPNERKLLDRIRELEESK